MTHSWLHQDFIKTSSRLQFAGIYYDLSSPLVLIKASRDLYYVLTFKLSFTFKSLTIEDWFVWCIAISRITIDEHPHNLCRHDDTQYGSSMVILDQSQHINDNGYLFPFQLPLTATPNIAAHFHSDIHCHPPPARCSAQATNQSQRSNLTGSQSELSTDQNQPMRWRRQ